MSGQDTFIAGLRDPDLPRPDGLTDGVGRPAGRRYDVYRNNVAVSLREALETGFPAVAKLIGAQNFANVAGLYVQAHPPSSPLMMHYGSAFPAFLGTVPQLQTVGYLADVARLELAMRQAYHAADAQPMNPADLQDLDEDALMFCRLGVAPALRILQSPWPVLSIYNYTLLPDQPKPSAQAETVLILRPEFDPEPHVIPTPASRFVDALLSGARFKDALATAGDDLDLPGILGLLLAGGALTHITKDT